MSENKLKEPNTKEDSSKNIGAEEESNNVEKNNQNEKPVEEAVEEKLQKTEDKLLRSLAEIENQRRRFEKEIKDAFEFGSFNFAKESLAALDNIQRAKEAIKSDEILKSNKDLDKFLENITVVEKDLISIFEKNKIKKIITINKKFDPNIHQAMSEIDDENAETGTVLQEIQAGYMFGERLLRPALVIIAKKNTAKNEETKDKKEDK